MAGDIVGIEAPAHVDNDAGRFQQLPIRVVGVGAVSVALILFVKMVRGLARARVALADYESAHGPLPIVDGVVVHHDDAIRELCDTLAANAGFVYPFGGLAFVGPLTLAVIGGLLIWRSTLPVRSTIGAFVVSIAAAIWTMPVTGDINAVLE